MMGDAVDLQLVVKHIVDGTFDQSLCRICLLPLEEFCENIFTKICTENQEFCVADVMRTVFHLQFSEADKYSVCHNCFVMASTTYKFYILSKRSSEIMDFYVKELENNVNSVYLPDDTVNDTLCITLPEYKPTVENCNFSIDCCISDVFIMGFEEEEPLKKEIEIMIKNEPTVALKGVKKVDLEEDDKVIVIVEEDGKKTFYKLNDDGTSMSQVTSKKRKIQQKKRNNMTYMSCSKCPVKYRYFAKLKFHMKNVHNIDLFLCKVCLDIIEDVEEFEKHISAHTDVYQCNICNTIFKKATTLVSHLQWHESKNISNTDEANVCEMCGCIFPSEDQLKDHYDKKHDKKYTCHYCGKMYKGELSCQAHIAKHEKSIKKKERLKKQKQQNEEKEEEDTSAKDKKTGPMCSTCGKNFVDERSLMWHLMLHTNERPYACDVCGRGFISLNRKNQHVLCAHTMPTKRCPLCPALFHLRSMVNTHIKKVHLNAHKRRNRKSKHQNVHWRTETVPIQELSVDIQNEILERKTEAVNSKPDTAVNSVGDDPDNAFDDDEYAYEM